MNILLTSVGRRTYLVNYFKKALDGKGEVHVANSSSVSPAFIAADYTFVTPLIYDNSYIPSLLDYCKKNKIDILISLFDIDLPILSDHKSEFEKVGTKVVVSDAEFIQICNDKWKTYLFLKENGFNVPKTFLTLENALSAVEAGNIHYPLMIKPRWGMGSISVYEAENKEELCVFYKKARRNIEKTYLKYESAEDIEESILIQEKMNGQEYGLDIINDLKANYVNTCVKMKMAMRSGETDCAITMNNNELKSLGKKLSVLTKHIANLDVDVFEVQGQYYVLEMNARFGGGYPFSHMAGVDLPYAIVSWAQNQEVDSKVLVEKPNVFSHKDIALVQLPEDYFNQKISK